MTQASPAASPRAKARLAGLLYLVTIFGGAFALMAREAMMVPGDAAATAAGILASEQLYRFAFVAELVAAASYVGVIAILYELLAPAGRTLSRAAAFFGLAGCAVSAAISAGLLSPAILSGGAAYLAAFSPDQQHALALASLKTYARGYNIGSVFFGVYCVLVGSLVLRSAFLPRLLGLLMALAGLAYLFNSVSIFLYPDFAAHLFPWVLAPGLLGEGGLTLWLILVGLNAGRWREQAAAAYR